MANRPCLTCGRPSAGSRCPAHRKGQDRPSSTQRGYGRAYQSNRRRVIDAWVAAHGWVCPGYMAPAHPVEPGALTGDHIYARSTHPELAHDIGNLAVLCLPCNVRKSNTPPDAA